MRLLRREQSWTSLNPSDHGSTATFLPWTNSGFRHIVITKELTRRTIRT